MLNKKSTTKNLWKTSLVFPLVLVFMLVFNVKTEAKILPPNPSNESEDVNLSEPQQELLEANFTESTSRAQLREYEDVFAERNIDLKTDQIEYSADRLKQIKVQFILPEGSSQEHISRTTNDGKLIPFKLVATFDEDGQGKTIFFVEEDRENRITSEKVDKTPSQINRKMGNGISIKPLKARSKNDSINRIYVINGERIENESIAHALDPKQIDKIEVLKGASAISLYGQAAKEGAVIITTKKAKDSTNTGSFHFKTRTLTFKDSAKGNGRTYQASKIRFLEKDSVSVNRRELLISGVESKHHDNPLIIVDGEEKPADFQINDIDEENIKSMNIIKGEGAVEKRGEKASGGVIEITTKTGKDAKDNP